MRIAAYARYSSDNQREESITAQLDAIKSYAKQHHYTIVKIYADEAKSATTDNRPQFLQMVSDSKLNIFDAVIIHKLDRFSRNRYDSAIYKKKLKDNGVKLLSVLENIDDSPESIILESVLQGMAEYFSANLAREVMKGMRQTAIQGKHNGGKPPLGYDLAADKTLVINEREADAIRLIFERYIDGFGYMTIAKELHQNGYKTKSGKQFCKRAIHDILVNEKYAGTYVFNRRANGKDLSKLKSDEEIIRIENSVPAIITKEMFETANNRIKSQKTGKRVVKMNYLLTGKFFCGECMGKYTGAGHVKGRDRNTENPTLYYRYACQSKCGNKPVRKELVENAVINEILERVLSDEDIPVLAEALILKIKEHQQTFDSKEKNIKEEMSKLKSQIDKDFQLYYEDLMDKHDLAKRTNEKKLRITQLEHELVMLESKSYAPDKNKILAYLYEQRANLQSGDDKLQQKAINAFVSCVIKHGDRIDIDLIIDENTDSEKGDGGEPHIPLTLSIELYERT